jgi:hypothetical protein
MHFNTAPSASRSSKWYFSSGFPLKPLHIGLRPIPATYQAHLIHFYLITRKIFDEPYKSESSPLYTFLQSPFTSRLLVPNVLLRTVFSNSRSLCFSLNVRDQVSHTHKTTGEVMR